MQFKQCYECLLLRYVHECWWGIAFGNADADASYPDADPDWYLCILFIVHAQLTLNIILNVSAAKFECTISVSFETLCV